MKLRVLALARTGATEAARREVQKLIEDGADDPETLVLLARTHKDTFLIGVHDRDSLRAAART